MASAAMEERTEPLKIKLEHQHVPVYNSELLGRTLAQKDIYRLDPDELEIVWAEASEALEAVNADLAEALRLNALPPDDPGHKPIDRLWYKRAKTFRRCLGASLETIRDAKGSVDPKTIHEQRASAEIARSYRRHRRQCLVLEHFVDMVVDQIGVQDTNALICEARARADEEVDDGQIETPEFALD